MNPLEFQHKKACQSDVIIYISNRQPSQFTVHSNVTLSIKNVSHLE